ncbi:hypothetical protein PG1C_05325 [Rugosibacter aromaticivorans]|uniref:Uncharacterized protein n=1 Tax=Rugosibacter aromaticivorans TaxID=1565605 RepID=A0A0C5JKY8_9PROT|nr:hypothetical protein PG1C_05325 [Rugosibacter aromaticivorans]
MWFNPAQLIKTAKPLPATFATSATFSIEPSQNRTKSIKVAKVATSPSAKISVQEKVGADDTAAIWRVTYPDGRTAEVHCTPSATLTQILETRPGAMAELLEPVTPRTPAPMTGDDEKLIRAWLALIKETDPATIAEVIGQCQQDAEARDYFTGRAAVELIQKGGE